MYLTTPNGLIQVDKIPYSIPKNCHFWKVGVDPTESGDAPKCVFCVLVKLTTKAENNSTRQ